MKRRLPGDAAGGPLGATMAGAKVHDPKRLAGPLEAGAVARPQPAAEVPPHLCLDQGDAHPAGHATMATHHDLPQIRRSGEDKLDHHGQKTDPARRWVVDRTLAWLAKGRGLLVRYEKKAIHF